MESAPFTVKEEQFQENSRVVFHYNGLLEVDEFGGYKKVGRNPVKQRLVTWTPRRKGNLEATTRRISTNTKGLVTWVPKLDVKIANEKEKVIFENNP